MHLWNQMFIAFIKHLPLAAMPNQTTIFYNLLSITFQYRHYAQLWDCMTHPSELYIMYAY